MASGTEKLAAALKDPVPAGVYYLASTDAAVLYEAAAQARAALAAAGADDEGTRIDGPLPDLGEVVAAAGAISFFGTPRLVELRQINPAAMGEKDVAELAGLFADVENAVLLVTALYKDKKAATGKKARALFEAAGAAGFAAELEKPGRRENLAFIEGRAAALGARFAAGAAQALLERAGDDHTLLESETAKLAAYAGYGTIDTGMVERLAVHSVEADVFELARAITAGRRAAAHEKLADLLELRHEPIAIAAALAGSFIDMLRVRLGAEQGIPVGRIFTDFGYKGSDWRLQKAKESAARYTTAGLQSCVLCLAELDRRLKSSALPDKAVLLQAAVGELLLIRERR